MFLLDVDSICQLSFSLWHQSGLSANDEGNFKLILVWKNLGEKMLSSMGLINNVSRIKIANIVEPMAAVFDEVILKNKSRNSLCKSCILELPGPSWS